MLRRPVLVLSLLLAVVALPTGPALARSAPNVKVTRVSADVSRVQAFGTFSVKDTVVRTGRVPRGLHVEYWLSLDGAKDAADVPLLGVRPVPKGPGRDVATTRVTVFGLTPPGRYRVLACADPGGDLEEATEKDNCAAAPAPVTVTAVPTGLDHDVTTTLATGRSKDLEIFLHDVDRFGTESGQVTVTGPDGTRYTLSVPEDSALVALPLTITPVASVSGLPGSPRVMGVKITPERDLARGATLTVTPADPLREDRALPAAYDGDGSHVRLTPMTSKTGTFTFQLTHLGGFLLVQGHDMSPRAVARQAGGATLKDLYSWSPTSATEAGARDTQTALGFERQRQLLGSDDDGDTQAAIFEAAVRRTLAAARAEIAATGADPTIGHWDGLLRFLVGVQGQLQLIGDDQAGPDDFADLLPLLRPVYADVVAGVHDCDDGMGDVLGTVVLRAANDVTSAMFDLPADTSTDCTRLRAHVSYVEHSFVDDELQSTTDYSAGITWQPKDVLDFSDQPEDAAYSAYSFHDVCEHADGPLTPEVPWTLSGVSVDWDALFQRWTGQPWEDPEETPFQLVAHLGSASQPGVLDDPGCDEASGVTYGPDWSPRMPLTYEAGVLSGERVDDDTESGSHHVEIRYDVTAVR